MPKRMSKLIIKNSSISPASEREIDWVRCADLISRWCGYPQPVNRITDSVIQSISVCSPLNVPSNSFERLPKAFICNNTPLRYTSKRFCPYHVSRFTRPSPNCLIWLATSFSKRITGRFVIFFWFGPGSLNSSDLLNYVKKLPIESWKLVGHFAILFRHFKTHYLLWFKRMKFILTPF